MSRIYVCVFWFVHFIRAMEAKRKMNGHQSTASNVRCARGFGRGDGGGGAAAIAPLGWCCAQQCMNTRCAKYHFVMQHNVLLVRWQWWQKINDETIKIWKFLKESACERDVLDSLWYINLLYQLKM